MEISTSLSTKLRIAMLILFSMFVIRGFAQTTVQASQITKDIREGKNISYENATIVGDLDFTYMDDKLPDLPRKSKWWNNGGDNTVDESIDVNITFKNCTFKDDVLAYIHDDPSGYTFIADFDKDVIFKNCEFLKDAMFKYSDFDGAADFSGTKFRRESTFKYAEFDEKADFSNTLFDDDATFKYAQFDEGASFKDAVFDESWNIKYMKARGDFDIAGLKVGDDIDAKYTKINGRSFTNYLIESRN
ncbi:MAG: pentapeptide repeat-containing protein [Ekhidna sp.]|uniref:pentapeptide repeat-containing protein n=1 Tax=Ekhidna sp. TaxID=2608089 RepID=UPI0032ED881A